MKKAPFYFACFLLLDGAVAPLVPATVVSPSIPVHPPAPTAAKSSSPVGDGGQPVFASSLASCVESNISSRSQERIYLFQDIHAHIGSQINLAGSIVQLERYAARKGKPLVIAVEGASGEIDLSPVNSLSHSRTKAMVGSGLIQAGYLFGEEHAALVSDPGRIRIIGVDSADLYERNREARDRSRNVRERVLKTIRDVRRRLDVLGRYHFNGALTGLQSHRRRWEEGRLLLGDYVKFLHGIDPALFQSYSTLATYLNVLRQEDQLDFDPINQQRERLIRQRLKTVSDAEARKMADHASQFREGRLSPLAYYASLPDFQPERYPALKSYIAYLIKAGEVNMERAIDEISKMEKQLAKKFIRHPFSRKLYENSRWLDLQDRTLSLMLTPEEWENQKDLTDEDFIAKWSETQEMINEQATDLGYSYPDPVLSEKDVKDALKGARKFYTLAEDRSRAMMNNFSGMRESQAIHDCVIVFVAGGFHAPALTAFMRDHNLNYTVWRPQPEPAVSMPKGYFYPPYRLNASSRRVYFLRPPGGFSLPGGVPFVRRLILSSDHRLPPSGWPSPDEEKRSAWRQFSNATEWAWKTLRASFPSLNLFKIPTDPRNVSYVASTVRLLAKAAGQNADRFADGLNSILIRGVPREIQEEAYAAVDLDSYGLENFLAQGNHLLRLFSALQARAERPSASGGRVVFFSSRLREIQKEKINNLINSANRRSKGIGFSFIERSTQNDIAQLFIENGIPDANLREDNVFILSTSDIGYENAKYVPIKGLPHLALAVFAYTHFKDAQSVLDRLVRLFERLTSLRMNGSLNKRIMAELISKTSA